MLGGGVAVARHALPHPWRNTQEIGASRFFFPQFPCRRHGGADGAAAVGGCSSGGMQQWG